jgi:hypothetical protein
MMFRIAIVALVTLVVGCAGTPQIPVPLATSEIAAKDVRVGVAMTPLPKLDTQFPGAGCLLCIAAAAAANSSLTDHTRTLPYEDLPKLKNALAERIRKNGAGARALDEDLNLDALPDFATKGPNIAKKDFSSLQKKYNIDKLIVINVNSLGMLRTYSAYFPTSEPKALFQGIGFMVNLKTNVYEWYMPLQVLKAAEGKWDEPPRFPGLSNAYFQALEIGKDSFLAPFGN